jgi:hypothetical protein
VTNGLNPGAFGYQRRGPRLNGSFEGANGFWCGHVSRGYGPRGRGCRLETDPRVPGQAKKVGVLWSVWGVVGGQLPQRDEFLRNERGNLGALREEKVMCGTERGLPVSTPRPLSVPAVVAGSAVFLSKRYAAAGVGVDPGGAVREFEWPDAVDSGQQVAGGVIAAESMGKQDVNGGEGAADSPGGPSLGMEFVLRAATSLNERAKGTRAGDIGAHLFTGRVARRGLASPASDKSADTANAAPGSARRCRGADSTCPTLLLRRN